MSRLLLYKQKVNFYRVMFTVFIITGSFLLLLSLNKQNFLGSYVQELITGGVSSTEPENGAITQPVFTGSDISASGGKYVQFGNSPSSAAFQPTAPYYATFFYPWYKNPDTDGSWSDWNDPNASGGSHNPPVNWFSNYLPDYDPAQFNPVNELYSSNNYPVFTWQLSKLAEAKQEIGISSWWGQNHKTDNAFRLIISDFMNRVDNPYPKFRWALYYEKEGFGNPTVSELTGDLNYLLVNYANQPSMLKVNGKPVMFVYGDAADSGSTNSNCNDTSDTSMTHRWYQANSQVNNSFYIVLKVFTGFKNVPCQPDSWHQYSPAVRSDSQGTYSYAVSPGFWLDGNAVRLNRDPVAFESAVQNMVASSATWKLTETWNEWGEGTSVEPGDEVLQMTGTGTAVLNPNSTQGPFKNTYVDILNRNLPPLE